MTTLPLFPSDRSPVGLMASRKVSGAPATWTGGAFQHPSGRLYPAPASFWAAFPRRVLRGVLVGIEKGAFTPSDPSGWSSVVFHCYDAPEPGWYLDARLRRLAEKHPLPPNIVVIPQTKIESEEQFSEFPRPCVLRDNITGQSWQLEE